METVVPVKDHDYYMNQNYKYLLWFDEDVWFIKIPALKGCMSHGKTIAEALEMVEDAKDGWVEGMLEFGGVIPDSDIE